MTVVLTLRCADGLVIAADTQVTDSDRGMSYPARKLHPLGSHAAWAGSGARSVLTDLERIFTEESGAICESEAIDRAIQARVHPVLKHHYETFIPDVPGEEGGGTPSAYVLAAGYSGQEPWIVEVTPHAMVSRYEDIGFHAIGSGAPMAQQAGTLLAHFRMTERSLDHGVMGAVRVLSALTTTAPSVGGEIDVFRITPTGAQHLEQDEIDEARRHVARWEELEQQALDTFFD